MSSMSSMSFHAHNDLFGPSRTGLNGKNLLTSAPKGNSMRGNLSSRTRRNPWDGFLPPQSIAMAKTRPLRSAEWLGDGDLQAQLWVLGEAESKDWGRGQPFSDQGGQLLDRMLQAIGLQRSQIYLVGLHHSPPDLQRSTRLIKRINQTGPQVIFALGKIAIDWLFPTETTHRERTGQWLDYHGSQLMLSYHPTELIKNPLYKKEAWTDLQAIAKKLHLPISTQTRK